jgi:hypothetical protein
MQLWSLAGVVHWRIKHPLPGSAATTADKTSRPASRGKAGELHRFTRILRFSVRQLLICLVLLLVVRPIFEGSATGRIIESLLFTFILISSLMAVGVSRWEMGVGLFLIVPAFAFRWLTHLLPLQPTEPVPLICFSLAIAFTIWQMLRSVLRAERVDADVLCAGISIYLLLGQLWSNLYLLLDRFSANAFLFPALPDHALHLSGDDAIYFSMSALTTAGFGDIVPRSPVARSLSTLESAVGVLYLAVLMGRLVAMHLQFVVAAAKPADGKS